MPSGRHRSYKSEIVIEYCEKFPYMSTRALSRLIYEQNKLDFAVPNSARTLIQRVRGECSQYSFKDTVHLHTDKKTKMKRMKNKHVLPESDYDEVEVFAIPTGYKRVFCLSDVHIPYQDNRAIEAAVGYAKKWNPDVIYLNGDIMDVYQGSRFVKDRRMRDLAGELQLTGEFLDWIKGEFPKAKVYYKMGNHEERWETYLKTHAPELLGISEFNLDTLLKFGERGIGLVKSRQYARAGKLYILHGHELFRGFGGQVNPARTAFLRTMHNVIVGHHHQTSEHTEKTIDGSIITTYSQGCLCGLKPDYMPNNKWNHGFALIEMNNENYKLENYRIVRGEVY